jgi:flagellar biosynthesis protein FlhB
MVEMAESNSPILFLIPLPNTYIVQDPVARAATMAVAVSSISPLKMLKRIFSWQSTMTRVEDVVVALAHME